MKKYDVIVIGSGCGALVTEEAVSHGLRTAFVDKGPVGGTCLNLGCIPSKMLIYTADQVVDIQESKKLGITSKIVAVDFNAIMNRMRKSIKAGRDHMTAGLKQTKGLDFYNGVARFTGDYTLEVNGERIRGEKIVIASGSRPFIPPIKGLESINYLTNETALQLKERPDSLIIVGGGYIAVEYGHFFAAMGTRVTILELADRLVLAEEPEISNLLKEQLSERMTIHIGSEVIGAKSSKNGVAILIKDRNSGKERRVTAQSVMIAVGRVSNADILEVTKTGVELDKKGFVKVDERLQTNKENIFAVGDANGQQMFTHVANKEAWLVAENMLHDAGLKMDYTVIPHAVYSHPQIASVGLQEASARKTHDILVGRTNYFDIAKGEAMMEQKGYAKAIVEKDRNKILGFHIIGPYAPELIQEVVNAMTSGGHIDEIDEGIHIHPALSELIPTALNSVE